MNSMAQFVIGFLLELVCFLFMARFLLQACGAGLLQSHLPRHRQSHGPIFAPLAHGSAPVSKSGLGGLWAAWATAGLMHTSFVLISGGPTRGALAILVMSLLHVLLRFINLFWWSILIVIIASFLAPARGHPFLTLLHQITEPLLAPARRVIPPLGGLDLSPMLVILALGLVERILPQMFGAIF